MDFCSYSTAWNVDVQVLVVETWPVAKVKTSFKTKFKEEMRYQNYVWELS